MTTQSSILAWRISWTEEPGRLQSMGSQRIGHSRVTKHSTHTFIPPILWAIQLPSEDSFSDTYK